MLLNGEKVPNRLIYKYRHNINGYLAVNTTAITSDNALSLGAAGSVQLFHILFLGVLVDGPINPI